MNEGKTAMDNKLKCACRADELKRAIAFVIRSLSFGLYAEDIRVEGNRVFSPLECDIVVAYDNKFTYTYDDANGIEQPDPINAIMFAVLKMIDLEKRCENAMKMTGF